MKTNPSIETCFEIYVRTVLTGDVNNPNADQRLGFFCGFHSCLLAVEALAEISDKDADEGDNAWQGLLAEFERFAASHEYGESISTNH